MGTSCRNRRKCSICMRAVLVPPINRTCVPQYNRVYIRRMSSGRSRSSSSSFPQGVYDLRPPSVALLVRIVGGPRRQGPHRVGARPTRSGCCPSARSAHWDHIRHAWVDRSCHPGRSRGLCRSGSAHCEFYNCRSHHSDVCE